MATVIRQGTRDELPLKIDTVTDVRRVMVTLVDATGADAPISVSGTFAVASEYPEGSAHTTGDTGSLSLGIVNENETTLAAEGQYTGHAVDAEGRTLVTGSAGMVPLLVDGSGVTQPVSISGTVPVSIAGTVAISAASLPLPAGASTLAEQQTQSTSLAAIQASLAAPLAIAEPVTVDNAGTFAVQVTALPGSPAQEHITAASPHAARLSDGAAFYVGAKTGQLPAALGANSGLLVEGIAGGVPIPVTGGGGGTQYTEGDTDPTITGTALMWEDSSPANTLVVASAAKPLPASLATLPPLAAGTANIGDVDVLTLPALPAGTNNIGDVDVLTVPAPLNVVGGGSEATALRVTIANDSTGLIAVTGTVGINPAFIDGAAFTHDSSRILPAGFIVDETTSAAIQENDAGAARMDSKRAIVVGIEDLTTRGQRLTITAANAAKVDGSGVTQPVSSTTLATEVTLALAAASLNVIDDWDESDRAKVNPIVGVAGVAAGAGATGTTTQRVVLATDDLAVASLAVLDDWDESDRAKVNIIAGQAGVAAGTGVDGATVQRVTLATNVALPAGANSIGQVTANAGTNLNTSALATESTLAAASAKLPATLGQKTMANSFAVVLASDQAAIPVTGAVDTELPAPAALTDSDFNPTVPGVGAYAMAWNGARWFRVPGDATDGLTVNTELPAAAALSDTIGNPTTPMIGAAGMLWTGSVWIRAPGTLTGGAEVGSDQLPALLGVNGGLKIEGVSGGGISVNTQDASGSLDNVLTTVGSTFSCRVMGRRNDGLATDFAGADLRVGLIAIDQKGRVHTASSQLPTVLAAGGGIKSEGGVASDAPIVANPLTIGGRASLATPTAVSTDGDAVNFWSTRTGAAIVGGRASTAVPAAVASDGDSVAAWLTRTGAGVTHIAGTADALVPSGNGLQNDALRVTIASDSTGVIALNGINPGTGGTSLGKAEDSGHNSGDTGVAVWGVSAPDISTVVHYPDVFGTAGDYTPFAMDRRGRAIVIAAAPVVLYTVNFTATGLVIDTVHDISLNPCTQWSMLVAAVGGTLTSWDFFLQGSLDGTNFGQSGLPPAASGNMITHSNTLGDLQNQHKGTGVTQICWPVAFIRIRKAAGTNYGTATSINVTVFGTRT